MLCTKFTTVFNISNIFLISSNPFFDMDAKKLKPNIFINKTILFYLKGIYPCLP